MSVLKEREAIGLNGTGKKSSRVRSAKRVISEQKVILDSGLEVINKSIDDKYRAVMENGVLIDEAEKSVDTKLAAKIKECEKHLLLVLVLILF